MQTGIKQVLQLVTKPRHVLHGVNDPMHGQHGQKELPTAYRPEETPGKEGGAVVAVV